MTEILATTILIPVREGTIHKNASNIIRIQASSNYSRIYCNDERYPIIVAKVLQWFQNKLPQQDFIRVHRTHLVNRKFIDRKTSSQLHMQNGDTVGISKRRRGQIQYL